MVLLWSTLATGTEAVNRRISKRLADRYCSSGSGEHSTCASRAVPISQLSRRSAIHGLGARRK
eukprot:6921834-Prymnesium_polylepis.1